MQVFRLSAVHALERPYKLYFPGTKSEKISDNGASRQERLIFSLWSVFMGGFQNEHWLRSEHLRRQKLKKLELKIPFQLMIMLQSFRLKS